MSYKTLTLKILAVLGIPLFPLGARFYLSHNSAAVVQEATRRSQAVREIPAWEAGPEGFAPPESFAGDALPPVSPETLARVFSPPNRGAAGEGAAGASPAAADTRPVPGDGKFSYLGSIRDSHDQEWLYIKEEETGRVIPVNARAGLIDEERCVVEIGGTAYFIRRK
jgi:hypothetical protein